MAEYVPGQVYINLIKLINYRGATLEGDFLQYEKISDILNKKKYTIIHGIRKESPDVPRGDEHIMIILIPPGSEYANKSSKFIKLFKEIPKSDYPMNVIFVSEDGFTSHIVKCIVAYKSENPTVYIENYDYTMFKICVPEHSSVPLHVIMPEKEIDEFCTLHKTIRNRFQKISTHDPVAVWIGGRAGMTVKIDRL